METEIATDYRELIRRQTVRIDSIERADFSQLAYLADEIQKGKINLKVNSVQFMIAKVLNSKGRPIDLRRAGYFNLLVLGDFKKTFSPTFKVAQALAVFYQEFQILPRLVVIPQYAATQDLNRFSKIIQDGVLIYDRG